MIITGAPASAKIGDIPSFTPDVLSTVPIEDARPPLGPLAQLPKSGLFVKPYLWFRGVTENEEIEMVEDTKGVKRLVHRLEPRKDTVRRFIVDRHEEGRARREGRHLQGRYGDATDATAPPQREKPYHPIDERQSDPHKIDGEDDQQSNLEPRHAGRGKYLIHLETGGGCECKRGTKYDGASASGSRSLVVIPHATAGFPPFQILYRHKRCRLVRYGTEGWPYRFLRRHSQGAQ